MHFLRCAKSPAFAPQKLWPTITLTQQVCKRLTD